MTDEKHGALLNFVCSIVSSLLFNQIDLEPLIGLPMNNEGSLKPKIKKLLAWLACNHPEAPVDVNDVHNFVLQMAMKGVHIPLNILTHAIVTHFKM